MNPRAFHPMRILRPHLPRLDRLDREREHQDVQRRLSRTQKTQQNLRQTHENPNVSQHKTEQRQTLTRAFAGISTNPVHRNVAGNDCRKAKDDAESKQPYKTQRQTPYGSRWCPARMTRSVVRRPCGIPDRNGKSENDKRHDSPHGTNGVCVGEGSLMNVCTLGDPLHERILDPSFDNFYDTESHNPRYGERYIKPNSYEPLRMWREPWNNWRLCRCWVYRLCIMLRLIRLHWLVPLPQYIMRRFAPRLQEAFRRRGDSRHPARPGRPRLPQHTRLPVAQRLFPWPRGGLSGRQPLENPA